MTEAPNHPDALDCTLYRPDERHPEEETDLGDGRVHFEGAFEPPQDWDAAEREDYFDGCAPENFMVARIASLAPKGSAGHFVAEPGDYVAVVEAGGLVQMYYLYDRLDDGRLVMIREDALDD